MLIAQYLYLDMARFFDIFFYINIRIPERGLGLLEREPRRPHQEGRQRPRAQTRASQYIEPTEQKSRQNTGKDQRPGYPEQLSPLEIGLRNQYPLCQNEVSQVE